MYVTECSAEAIRTRSWYLLLLVLLIGAQARLADAVDWQPYGNRYAIITMSDGPNSDKYFWPVTRSMYGYLRAMGFAKESIRFLAPGKYVTRYPDIVFGEATETGIEQACQWAKSTCTSEDLLYVFWISHGTASAFTTAGNPVRHSTLSSWMKGITAKQIIGVYQPCLSGAVIDEISGKNVITTTSTNLTATNDWPWAENIAFALAGAPHYEQWMNPDHELEPAKYPADRDGDGQVSITEAYIWVAKHRYTEGSMFDDNGDGVGGQWNADTFDPTDPNKDGYIGTHYSLTGWKQVGTAPVELGPLTRQPGRHRGRYGGCSVTTMLPAQTCPRAGGSGKHRGSGGGAIRACSGCGGALFGGWARAGCLGSLGFLCGFRSGGEG